MFEGPHHSSYDEVHALSITDDRISFHVSKEHASYTFNQQGILLPNVLQILIYDSFSLDVELDLMETGIRVERKVIDKPMEVTLALFLKGYGKGSWEQTPYLFNSKY